MASVRGASLGLGDEAAAKVAFVAVHEDLVTWAADHTGLLLLAELGEHFRLLWGPRSDGAEVVAACVWQAGRAQRRGIALGAGDAVRAEVSVGTARAALECLHVWHVWPQRRTVMHCAQRAVLPVDILVPAPKAANNHCVSGSSEHESAGARHAPVRLRRVVAVAIAEDFVEQDAAHAAHEWPAGHE